MRLGQESDNTEKNRVGDVRNSWQKYLNFYFYNSRDKDRDRDRDKDKDRDTERESTNRNTMASPELQVQVGRERLQPLHPLLSA